MRSVDTLIALVRQRTKNPNYSATEGIVQEQFVELLNQAQDHLQASIANVYSAEFITSEEINIVGNQESYTPTKRVLAKAKRITVEYSDNGDARNYDLLDPRVQRDRNTDYGVPTGYVWRNGQVLLGPIPSSTQGKIRLTYYEELDDLDIQRGTVNGTPSGTTIVTSGMDITSTPINATNVRYICISDKDGNVMLRNGLVSSWGSPNFTMAANVSTYLVGAYTLANLASGIITFGRYTTNFSKLADHCERYLMVYTQKRIMTIDESSTSMEEDLELKNIETDILNSYSDESMDVKYIPVLDPDIYY